MNGRGFFSVFAGMVAVCAIAALFIWALSYI